MPSSHPDQEQGEGHRLLGSGSYRSEQDVLSHLSTTSSKRDDPIGESIQKPLFCPHPLSNLIILI